MDSVAWYSANSGERTHDVATKQANAWNLYDMLGNVYEWTNDWFGSYQSGSVTDPRAAFSGYWGRMYRGGSWSDPAACSRPAYRNFDVPMERDSSVGFRVVRE